MLNIQEKSIRMCILKRSLINELSIFWGPKVKEKKNTKCIASS